MSKKFEIQNFLQILHQYLPPSSTVSPYFNSSYYSFLTHCIQFSSIYLRKNVLLRAIWGVLTPKPPLPTPLADSHGPFTERLVPPSCLAMYAVIGKSVDQSS